MSITHLYAAGRRVTAKEWAARREESIERIGALLAEKRLQVRDVVQAFGLNPSTAYAHMKYMEELGLAHRTGERDSLHREWWAAGRGERRANDVPVEPDEDPLSMRTVPARQIGMWRDPLTAALFGPARAV